jgi:hypothetical protein
MTNGESDYRPLSARVSPSVSRAITVKPSHSEIPPR